MARWVSGIIYFFISFCLVIGLAANGRAMEAIIPTYHRTTDTTRPVDSYGVKASAIEHNLSAILSYGRTQYSEGQFDQALETWTLATEMAQTAGDRLNYSLALSYLSLAHQALGQWSQADAAITQSMEAFEQFTGASLLTETNPFTEISLFPETNQGPSTRRNQWIIGGQILNTQGSLAFARGNVNEALEAWQQSGSFYQQADETQRYVGSLINQARGLQALGYFSQAHDTLAQAKASLEKEINVTLQVLGFHSLGDVLHAIGEHTTAKQVLTEGLTLAQRHGMISEQSALLISLGQIAETELALDDALDHYRHATSIHGPVASHIQAQLSELGLLVKMANWPEAEPLAAKIQRQVQLLAPSRSTLYSRIRFAHYLSQFPEPKDRQALAVELLAETVQQARQSGDRYAETYATGYLGNIYEQAAQWADANKLTQEALVLAQGLDATDIIYQWQWQLARILKRQGNQADALSAYKAAFESLKSLRYDLVSSTLDRQFSFKEEVEPVYREYVDLLLDPAVDISPATLQQARQVIESLQLAELSNFFQSTCIEGQAIAIDDVDQTDTAVIYPIVLGDPSSEEVNQRLEVIVSLPNQPLTHHTVPVSHKHFEKIVNRLLYSLTRPFPAPEGKDLGQEVYNWLIRPIENELAQTQVKTLVFILDGTLREIPMAALFDGEHYLIEDYQVALTPGLQLLNPQSLRRQSVKVLGAGLTESRHGFTALDNVGLELDTVKSTIPSRILLNQRFTSDTLQEQIKKLPFPIVHLATHGQFSSNADETFILAWDKPIKVGELSDILRTGDLTRLTPIELLIMSACETATGDDRAVLGLAGIAVRAGVRSTLASLWSVDDQSTAWLMSHLYTELANDTISKAEALRRAQLALLRDPDYRAPVYWSPFVLLGNWL
ncbi:MAG: CHAT domain-containing protein [Cyanobacteria bacterium P01_F01_bin.150]